MHSKIFPPLKPSIRGSSLPRIFRAFLLAALTTMSWSTTTTGAGIVSRKIASGLPSRKHISSAHDKQIPWVIPEAASAALSEPSSKGFRHQAHILII